MQNRVDQVVEDFGNEWTSYTQADIADEELRRAFEEYFAVVDSEGLPTDGVAADVGCGSGRWARFVAPEVGTLYCVEPSAALDVARENLGHMPNVQFMQADLDSMPLPDDSLDFLYCLGVLHHVPDPERGIRSCAAKLKPGGRMLAYIYYRFDTQPRWFRALWRASDIARRFISDLPHRRKLVLTQAIAVLVYWPLARFSRLAERLGADVTNFPLSYYRNRGFYSMKTDALDRFGTVLEHRFTQPEIRAMLEKAGLERIEFGRGKPYWCVTAVKAG